MRRDEDADKRALDCVTLNPSLYRCSKPPRRRGRGLDKHYAIPVGSPRPPPFRINAALQSAGDYLHGVLLGISLRRCRHLQEGVKGKTEASLEIIAATAKMAASRRRQTGPAPAMKRGHGSPAKENREFSPTAVPKGRWK